MIFTSDIEAFVMKVELNQLYITYQALEDATARATFAGQIQHDVALALQAPASPLLNMAHKSQSRTDTGLGVRAKVLKTM